MGLRDRAAAILNARVADETRGFGWRVAVTDPDGVTGDLVGRSTDIEQLIDPDTGQAVSGRFAGVFLTMDSLEKAGLGIPQGIADAQSKPWIVEFQDIRGGPYKFKVAQSNPDRAIGGVACVLEVYQ